MVQPECEIPQTLDSARVNKDLISSNSGSYYFFGGLLLVLSGFLEFILGNTFPSVVFSSYGAFFLSFAATLQPFYYAYGSYAPAGEPAAAGFNTVGFTASFAFFLIFMAILSLIFLVLSIRTNIVFVVIFLTLVIFFSLLAGVFWQNANGIGNADPSALALAHRLQVVSLILTTIPLDNAIADAVQAAGSFIFITTIAGFYLVIAILLATLDFPVQFPVGDLSTLVRGASERTKAKEHIV